MFETRRAKSPSNAVITMGIVVFHSVVHRIRKSQRSPIMSILTSIMQSVTMVLAFIFMMDILGMRGAAVRGDFVLYVMSGIFLYLTHTQTVGAVSGAETSSSPMMQHAPMNAVVSILAAALSTLYLQLLSMLVILAGYYVMYNHFTVYDAVGFMEMFLLAWASGCAIGILLYGLMPWAPSFISLLSTIYQRANMIFSGKMMLGNTLPATMLVMFDWNPLFHIIDQARGFAFINYNPRNSNLEYPIIMSLIFFSLGLIIQYYTNKRVTASWSAGK